MSEFRCFSGVLSLFILLAGAAMLTGCGNTTYGAARIMSVPNGAEVINLRDDSQLGTTPVEVMWKGEDVESEYVTVKFRKIGYKEKITSFWVNKRHETREAASKDAQPITVELEKKESK